MCSDVERAGREDQTGKHGKLQSWSTRKENGKGRQKTEDRSLKAGSYVHQRTIAIELHAVHRYGAMENFGPRDLTETQSHKTAPSSK